MVSPFSGSTDLGKLIKNATVKMCMFDLVWTGFVIGSKYGRTLVLTVAHECISLTSPEIEQNVRVMFLEDPNYYACRVGRYLQTSDILLLIIDGKSTDYKLIFPPRLGNKELLTESELLGSRGHLRGGQDWTFVQGNVATPRVVNNREPPVLGYYEKDLIYFEHRSDMGSYFSGAPLVNLGGYVVGMFMFTGEGMINKYNVLGAGPFGRIATAELEKIKKTYKMDKVRCEEELDKYQVSSQQMPYGRRDIEVINVLTSKIKYTIHVEYLERMLRSGGPQYERNLSLEDIYLAGPMP